MSNITNAGTILSASLVTVGILGGCTMPVGEQELGVAGCLKPATSTVKHGAKIDVSAIITEINVNAETSADYEEKLKTINTIPESVYVFQQMRYAHCVALKSENTINREQYAAYLKEAVSQVYADTSKTAAKQKQPQTTTAGKKAEPDAEWNESHLCPADGESKTNGKHNRLLVASGPGAVRVEMTAGSGNVWLTDDDTFYVEEGKAHRDIKHTTLSSYSSGYPHQWEDNLKLGQYVRYRSTQVSTFRVWTKSKDRAGFICKDLDLLK